MTHVHLIVGEPGVGKSWLMDRLTEGYHRIQVDGTPRREWVSRVPEMKDAQMADIAAVELGARAGKHPEGYPGTDAMSMTAIVDVERWLTHITMSKPVVAEGARLGVRRFADVCATAGHHLHVYHLVDPDRAAAQRLARGSNQKDSWIKGARTRAERFAMYVQEQRLGEVQHLTCPPEQVLAVLRRETGL